MKIKTNKLIHSLKISSIMLGALALTNSASLAVYFQDSQDLDYDNGEDYLTANASIGDVDGDGLNDIVLARGRHWEQQCWVLFNDGNRVNGDVDFDKITLSASDDSYTSALADLNNDARLDIVVGNDSKPKYFYLNHGGDNRSTMFGTPATYGVASWNTRNITVADLDGVNGPDIIVAIRYSSNPNNSPNFVCYNDGNGNFPTYEQLDGSAESATTIVAADINNDGRMDVIVPNRDGGQSNYYINNGGVNNFTKRPFGTGNDNTRACSAGYLNEDGYPEIILGKSNGAQVYVNNGGSSFSSTIAIGTAEPYSIAVADLDADGREDVILGAKRGSKSAIFWNDRSGANLIFSEEQFGNTAGSVYGMAIGDVNGDGSLDLVTARSDATTILFLGEGGGIANSPPTVSFDASTPTAIDEGYERIVIRANALDPDGAADIKELTLYLDGVEVGTDRTAAYRWSSTMSRDAELAGLSAGAYELMVVATDFAGGTGSDTLTLEVNGIGGGGFVEIHYEDFELGYGNWNDGGADCLRYGGGTHASQGTYAANLQDNTTTSVLTTDNLPLLGKSQVKVEFAFKAVSMELNEDFWLQISTNNGSSYSTVKMWKRGTGGDNFANSVFYDVEYIISGYTLNNQTRLRFRCDASANPDDVYLDEIRVLAK